jgi:hypothetical protein
MSTVGETPRTLFLAFHNPFPDRMTVCQASVDQPIFRPLSPLTHRPELCTVFAFPKAISFHDLY